MTSQGRDSVPVGGTATDAAFKWICPYCGDSRIDRYDGVEEGEKQTVAALRSHIAGSDGDGHGPRAEFPADRERTLFEYVCWVDGNE